MDSEVSSTRLLIPISALQHWSYCPRQCALIHQEQAFAENVYTLRGQAVHERVDMPGFESRAGVRTERALPIWCERLGLIGKADVVEFDSSGAPYPVEYKHGRASIDPIKRHHDDLQLAAQALCLEEMLNVTIAEGAIFQASSKKRRIVVLTPQLKAEVASITTAIREMLLAEAMPPPTTDLPRCDKCSLIDLCQPDALRQLAQIEKQQLFDPER